MSHAMTPGRLVQARDAGHRRSQERESPETATLPKLSTSTGWGGTLYAIQTGDVLQMIEAQRRYVLVGGRQTT